MVAHVCNLNSWQVEAWEFSALGLSEIHSEEHSRAKSPYYRMTAPPSYTHAHVHTHMHTRTHTIGLVLALIFHLSTQEAESSRYLSIWYTQVSLVYTSKLQGNQDYIETPSENKTMKTKQKQAKLSRAETT